MYIPRLSPHMFVAVSDVCPFLSITGAYFVIADRSLQSNIDINKSLELADQLQSSRCQTSGVNVRRCEGGVN